MIELRTSSTLPRCFPSHGQSGSRSRLTLSVISLATGIYGIASSQNGSCSTLRTMLVRLSGAVCNAASRIRYATIEHTGEVADESGEALLHGCTGTADTVER